MSKAIPTVQRFMTCDPHSVDEETLLSEAQNIMKDQDVRHLPVMKGKDVCGILSDRDIKYALGLLNADPKNIHVKDICHRNLYMTTPHTPIDQVTTEMAEHHYGCTVVVDNNNLVGIFTTVDACSALSEIVRERFH